MNTVEAFNVLMSGKKARNTEWVKASGCSVEREVALQYNKKTYTCVMEVDGEYRLY